jgi:hypothetical protein
MYDRGKIVTGIVIGLLLFLFPVFYNVGRAAKEPDPLLTDKAKQAKECIEPKSFMKTEHMKMLDEWRQGVVRDNERYYKSTNGKTYYMSLQTTCMDCHSNKSKFCDQCHNYMAVAPYCWDCHVAPKENG